MKRFYVNVYFTDLTSQLYFFTPTIWEKIGPSIEPGLLAFQVESLSNIPHGMITNGHPYSKYPFYNPPYFLYFKTGNSVDSNFLTFNNFQIPNSYGRVLCMLTYNDDIDKFKTEFKSDLHLPYFNTLSLNKVLEFHIYDSEKKIVEFMDLSQLYISIEVLEMLKKSLSDIDF